MAGKPKSRMELRRQAEAVEARDGTAPAKAEKATRAAKPRKTKEKPVAKKRLIWVLFNGSMKEEARFEYDQHDQALERIEQLRQKSKKMYFIQPVKEIIGEGGPIAITIPDIVDDEPKPRKRAKASDDDDEEPEEADDDGDDE